VLIVDGAVGSKDLVLPLQRLGIPARRGHLDYGDLAFQGRGVAGREVFIGIELKKVADLVNSLETGRLVGHQLPGLLKTYDYTWIVIEGTWRHDAEGRIIGFAGQGHWRVLSTRISADALEKRLLSLQLCAGGAAESTRRPVVRFVDARRDTLRFVAALYRWWTDQALDAHKSALQVYRAPAALTLSPFAEVVRGLPHVGVKKALELDRYFGGDFARAFGRATREDWQAVLGEKRGAAVYALVSGRP
jgi:ERCC4-type nuclease